MLNIVPFGAVLMRTFLSISLYIIMYVYIFQSLGEAICDPRDFI